MRKFIVLGTVTGLDHAQCAAPIIMVSILSNWPMNQSHCLPPELLSVKCYKTED